MSAGRSVTRAREATGQRSLARAAPITAAELVRMRRLHEQGLSCAGIARELGRSRSAVSRHCAAEGLGFAREKTKKATEARRADIAARRAEVSAQFVEIAAAINDRVMALLTGPEEQCKPWGIRDLAYASASLFGQHLAQAKQDAGTGAEDLSAFDRWLTYMAGDAIVPDIPPYSSRTSTDEGNGQ